MTDLHPIADSLDQNSDGLSRVITSLEQLRTNLRTDAARLREHECVTTPPPPEPPVTPPPADYPEPHRINAVRPGDLTLGDDGSLSSRHEFPMYAARRRGLQQPDGWANDYLTFDGWDFPRFLIENCKAGSKIDMIGCTLRDQRINGLSVNFYGDKNAGQNVLTDRPGGLHLRMFDCKFLRNYHPTASPQDTHSVGGFFRSRDIDDCSWELYNCLFRYNGAGPDRDATAGLTDHALYPQGRGKRLVTKGNCWLDGAAQCSKGGWEYVYHENFFAANYATFGFFGPDKGETDKFGQFTTTGGLKNGIIYGMTDILAENAPMSYGLILNGGCDITLENVHIVNPNPTFNAGRPLHAFHCVDQGGRPINVRFKNVHLYGYDVVWGGDAGGLTDESIDSGYDNVTRHPRLPDLDLNEMRQLLDSGEMRADGARAYAAEKLGVA